MNKTEQVNYLFMNINAISFVVAPLDSESAMNNTFDNLEIGRLFFHIHTSSC